MDMHTVDTKLTDLTPTGEKHEVRSEEGAHASAARGTDSKDHADRVEISNVSKMLAALSDQQDDSGDLQLPTDKLRRMIEG